MAPVLPLAFLLTLLEALLLFLFTLLTSVSLSLEGSAPNTTLQTLSSPSSARSNIPTQNWPS